MVERLLGNSGVPVYIKLQASGILTMTYLSALAYCGYDVITNHGNLGNMPPIVSFVLGTGLTIALQVLNIHLTAQQNEQTVSNTVNSIAGTSPAAASSSKE